ncbi:helix-turn-helix transcriptional regulator [Rurimicrobium arvi]|uniref:AraC family transcriptional regulator n=1 Tax=Rurimicrobium arvi TaxID=2049916 RepID=A0ABP8MFW4_9BACT
MPVRSRNIPVNSLTDGIGSGIMIDRSVISKADFVSAQQYEEATQAHRDEGHTFHFLERGALVMEIDFREHLLKAPCIVYMHPSQVHRILDFKNITVCSLAIGDDQLHTGYAALLEQLSPALPLRPGKAELAMLSDICALCLRIAADKGNRLHDALLRDSCNTLVAYIASLLSKQDRLQGNASRQTQIANSFKQLLDEHYKTLKRPAAYADMLHISVPYLNECVRHATGLSASQQIQDRIVLEAKRLLFHTGKSVKEIASELGYTDYPYFSRLFTKATGMSALTFRSKNHV